MQIPLTTLFYDTGEGRSIAVVMASLRTLRKYAVPDET
jgi:hypothetical protein